MKKLSSMIAVAIIMMAVVFVSCSKKDDVVQSDKSAQKVAIVKGDYVLKNGDITLKSAPTGETVTWTILTNNASHYSGAYYYTGGNVWLVNGNELVTGTTASNFWHASGNNPVSFPITQAVYSNDTPDENIRCIAETKDISGNLVYIGMIDFHPNVAFFPLTVNGYRFGDELYVDWSQIKNLPATDALSLKVTYTVRPADATATKAIAYGYLSGPSAVPNGQELVFADLKYEATGTTQTVDVAGTVGGVEVYNSVAGKIFGNVTVSLYEGTVLLSSVDVPAQGLGYGLKITATTTKVGAWDSGTINWHNIDILINGVGIEYN